MKFVKFEEKHIKDLLELSNNIFDHGWSENLFVDELKRYDSTAILLEEQEKIIGFIFARTNFEDMEILNIGIAKDYQNKGFGKLLLQRVLDCAEESNLEKIFLEVKEDNIPALKMYTDFGFVENRKRKNYYDDKDGIEMILFLD